MRATLRLAILLPAALAVTVPAASAQRGLLRLTASADGLREATVTMRVR